MARPKHRTSSDACADCGAVDPTWASVNRAILLCDECCSIHRSLGRHISHIKSLTKGVWSTSLLNMVRTLNDNGANSIWEHSLLDPSNSKINKRKPQPKDPLHPVKADFIKSKHQQLSFILRPSKEEACSEEELSRQLHSSVRTGNLETSLRLIAQGADPNYFYKDKGTMPLHMAAKAGQSYQAELLITNGANPSSLDLNGQTPAEIARMAGHLDLSDRLLECMYEVTDRLTCFLCNRKPNHKAGEHFIIPEWASIFERSDLAFQARTKLQKLPNYLLGGLASDVYDEVDRRETDNIWSACVILPEAASVPFLPVNPALSSTRNQGRQKLARFTAKEFGCLIIDILTEAVQRHADNVKPQLEDPAVSTLKSEQQASDDEPLYDSVASDDDYAAIPDTDADVTPKGSKKPLSSLTPGLPSVVELLKNQLMLSESMVRGLKQETERLQSTLEELSKENADLKRIIQRQSREKGVNGHANGVSDSEVEPVLDAKPHSSRGHQRPASMYEPREGLRASPSWSSGSKPVQHKQEPAEYDMPTLPSCEEVNRRTERVTKRIQELWLAMQSPTQREAFVPCAERIRVAVAELAAIFPSNPVSSNIRTALCQLNGNTGRLQAECTALQRCTSDANHMDRCLQQVRSCAYDIAKATKALVTQFQAC